MKLLQGFPFREIRFLLRLIGGPLLFILAWLRSRNYQRLVFAAPAIVLMGGFLWAVAVSWQNSRDPRLANTCREMARQAMEDGDLRDARLLYRRAQQLAPNDAELTLEFGLALFRRQERRDAYQVLSAIAPLQKTGYLPAHRFLSQNPPEGSRVQQDHFRALHLSHLVRNAAETRAERMQLFNILTRYNRLKDADSLVRISLEKYPEDRLLLARLKVKENDSAGAWRETEEACLILKARVEAEPSVAHHRIQLAQGYVFLGQFAEAIETLADALISPQTSDPAEIERLAAALSNTYFAWLSTLPLTEQSIQRTCLHRMLNPPSTSQPAVGKGSELREQFRTALNDPQSVWVCHAVAGYAKAALQKYEAAEIELRTAWSQSPSDPSTANNLAWVIFCQSGTMNESSPVQATEASQLADSDSSQEPAEARQPLLEALQMADHAVSEMPKIASFLETRAQIHAVLGNHANAVQDLLECKRLGKDTPAVQRTLESSQRKLRQSSLR